jgi:hypothetical protein
MLQRALTVISNKLPKVISPQTHAILDYAVVAGGFFAVAGLAWKDHKRAAITSLICGAAETGVAMFTDYPGGVAKMISFPTHGKIDAMFAGAIAAMPNLLEFEHEWPSTFLPHACHVAGHGHGAN